MSPCCPSWKGEAADSCAVAGLVSVNQSASLFPAGSSQTWLAMSCFSLVCRDRYYRAMLGRLPYRTSANLLFWGVFNQSHAKVMAIRSAFDVGRHNGWVTDLLLSQFGHETKGQNLNSTSTVHRMIHGVWLAKAPPLTRFLPHREINKAGLPGLYETILETAGPEIKRALEVVIESAEAEQPVIFFCKVGKVSPHLLGYQNAWKCNVCPILSFTCLVTNLSYEPVCFSCLERSA